MQKSRRTSGSKEDRIESPSPCPYSSNAEQLALNQWVLGSSPSGGTMSEVNERL